MSFTSDFNRVPSSQYLSPTPTVAGSQRTEMNSNAPGRTVGKTIFIIGANGDDTGSAILEIRKFCNDSKVTCEYAKCDAQRLPGAIKQLRKRGSISDNTQLVIDMHGKNKNGVHDIGPRSGPGADTFAVVEALREPLEKGGQACSANIYLVACELMGGDLPVKLLELHKKYSGACFLLSGKEGLESHSSDAALTAMVQEFADKGAPSSHLILGRMGSTRSSCITMIEGGAKATFHGVNDPVQLGHDGLVQGLAIITMDKRTFGDPGLLLGEGGAGESGTPPKPENTDGEQKALAQEPTPSKPIIVGDKRILAGVWKELEANGAGKKDQALASTQRQRIRARMCMKSKLDRLRRFLESDKDFLTEIERGSENARNGIFKLIKAACLDQGCSTLFTSRDMRA